MKGIDGGRRLRVVAVVTALAMAVTLLAAMPAQGAGGGSGPVVVDAHFYDPGADRPANFTCAPMAGAVSSMPVAGGSTQKGTEEGDTIRGTTYYEVCFYSMADGTIRSDGWERFTGTVDGCGTGSVTWHTTGYFTPDPETGTISGGGVWYIESGTGTGGLTGLRRGGGVWEAEASPTFESTGRMIGMAARC